MFTFIIFGMLIALCKADQFDKEATLRSFSNVLNHDGSYQFQYETTNGIGVQESGVGGYYASGSSQHYAPDGSLIQLTYTADENGFHPQGDHLPVAPPIPKYILRAIEWIKLHPDKQ